MTDDFDTTSTDAFLWAREFGKRANLSLEEIEWLHSYFANYWAAVNDPLAREIDRLRAQVAELQKQMEWLTLEEDSELDFERGVLIESRRGEIVIAANRNTVDWWDENGDWYPVRDWPRYRYIDGPRTPETEGQNN